MRVLADALRACLGRNRTLIGRHRIMAYDLAGDIRLDPRLKAILASMPAESGGDVDSRETLLAEANSDAARQQAESFRSFMELCDTEDAAPSAGLRAHTEKAVSEPDGNSINLRVIRPDHDEPVACVYAG